MFLYRAVTCIYWSLQRRFQHSGKNYRCGKEKWVIMEAKIAILYCSSTWYVVRIRFHILYWHFSQSTYHNWLTGSQSTSQKTKPRSLRGSKIHSVLSSPRIHFRRRRKSNRAIEWQQNESKIRLFGRSFGFDRILDICVYPILSAKAIRVLIPFATSYLWEAVFLAVAVTESCCYKYRSKINVEKEMRIALSSWIPRFEQLCNEQQAHPSH